MFLSSRNWKPFILPKQLPQFDPWNDPCLELPISELPPTEHPLPLPVNTPHSLLLNACYQLMSERASRRDGSPIEGYD